MVAGSRRGGWRWRSWSFADLSAAGGTTKPGAASPLGFFFGCVPHDPLTQGGAGGEKEAKVSARGDPWWRTLDAGGEVA